MKRKSAILIMTICSAIVFSACGNNDNTAEVKEESIKTEDVQENKAETEEEQGQEKPEKELGETDKEFLKDIEAAVGERWEYTNNEMNQSEMNLDVLTEEYLKLISIEEEKLLKYRGADFTDSKLSELSEKYLAALNAQREAVGFMKSDPKKMDYEWLKSTVQRYEVLETLKEEYGIGFSEFEMDQMSRAQEQLKSLEKAVGEDSAE